MSLSIRFAIQTMPTALAILVDGFEEIEAITPIDLLRRAGVAVTIATVEAQEARHDAGESATPHTVLGRCGIILQGDCSLAEALARQPNGYDCLLIPGGPGVKTLRASATVLDLVRQQHAARRLIAAICAAPLVMLDAGVLQGRSFTAHASVADELPQLVAEKSVITDGHIVTSRGAGTAPQFGLTLVERLISAEHAKRVATEIHLHN